MSPVSMAVEVLLAVLLAACLFYCWRLDKKLSALRNSEQGIRAAAAELNLAVRQAESAIKALRKATEEVPAPVPPTARQTPLRSPLDSARRRSL